MVAPLILSLVIKENVWYIIYIYLFTIINGVYKSFGTI